MEDLQKKYRQELKDLQSRIIQKKKSATKKTRKGVNDECAELERQLKERHQYEEANSGAESKNLEAEHNDLKTSHTNQPSQVWSEALDAPVTSLTISNESIDQMTAKKPNRQKARLARRAAEQDAAAAQAAREAEDVPDPRAKEREAMQAQYVAKGLHEKEIRSDGHCLYAAVADQLVDSGISLQPSIEVLCTGSEEFITEPSYKATRQVAAAYITSSPDEFAPFLEEPLNSYVRTIRDTGEWGGHLELLALAKAYCVTINVLQGNGHVDTIESGSKDVANLWLAYYRHSFGLGEHYNSLRKSK